MIGVAEALGGDIRDISGRAVPDTLRDFYGAYLSREPARLQAVLHDDVCWRITGPADRFDFYGRRQGRDAVIEVIARIMPCYFKLTAFEFEHLLVNGDTAATYGRVRARQRGTGRAIGFCFAHFLGFAGGKLLSFRAVADTFDTAEQVV